jgi:hypothetical protein
MPSEGSRGELSLPHKRIVDGFDEAAKGLAGGTISRRRALKLIGSALAGATLALIPGVASASPPAHSNAGGRFGSTAPPEHAHDRTGFGAGGRFGKGGPRRGCGFCSRQLCNGDSDCASAGQGCLCACRGPVGGGRIVSFCCCG